MLALVLIVLRMAWRSHLTVYPAHDMTSVVTFAYIQQYAVGKYLEREMALTKGR